MRLTWLTPKEAAQLARVPAHRISFDVWRRAKRIALIVVAEPDKRGAFLITGYFANDLIRAFGVKNAALKLASLEIARLIAASPKRKRNEVTN